MSRARDATVRTGVQITTIKQSYGLMHAEMGFTFPSFSEMIEKTDLEA